MKKEDEKAALTEEEKTQPTSESEAEDKKEPEEAPEEKADPETIDVKSDVERLRKIFPSLKADDIPDEVWERVEKGESLSGAYALWFLEGMKEKAKIDLVNRENSRKAPPRIKHDGADDGYFSPEEVRKMTQAQVRKNYDAIIRSMDRWNRN